MRSPLAGSCSRKGGQAAYGTLPINSRVTGHERTGSHNFPPCLLDEVTLRGGWVLAMLAHNTPLGIDCRFVPNSRSQRLVAAALEYRSTEEW